MCQILFFAKKSTKPLLGSFSVIISLFLVSFSKCSYFPFPEATMDQFQAMIEPARQFSKDSYRLVKRCTKPDRKEYQKIATATAIGFAIMGFIGFFVKLIHIPINNIIVGA
ncbi:CRE-EMO-1 protein [Caenorhabditis remanei]|uniref:CRE-EMO-1 protein n=2 Tax=Caenorhabditis remanei TaxID=31234 RepID=E3MTV5_CAERE|nr:CRE-EMO-1 protein [Caenorhabditis remanei]